MRTEFSHSQYFPSAVKQSKEVFNTIVFIQVLFWMLSLFYFAKGNFLFFNIRVKVIFPLMQRARYVFFLLDNSLQLLVVVFFKQVSHLSPEKSRPILLWRISQAPRDLMVSWHGPWCFGWLSRFANDWGFLSKSSHIFSPWFLPAWWDSQIETH